MFAEKLVINMISCELSKRVIETKNQFFKDVKNY